ncbi:metallopeptidase family protein [Sedimentitalea sp. HM32M-2]|uniref:metallopeptidase family protein n=1 Tax=Sedimentitalea sp. HM32M-2 TaxID=3351566 RepID=UPI0036449F41
MHMQDMAQDISLDHFLTVARATVAGLPEGFRGPARAVTLRVADWPDHEMLRNLGLARPLDLTGLYEGVPMTEKSVWDQPLVPDTVWLFREPILAEWRARGDVDLDDLITHVTIHEFAHHFGWSDAQIAAVDRWWE